MHKIAEWQDVDFDTFQNDIVPANKPALIRSLVTDWPAVEQCRSSAAATCQYVEHLDTGTPVYTIAAPPEAGGRFFYRDDLQGVNFNRGQIPLVQVLGQLMAQSDAPSAHSIAVQALSIRDALPDFEKENPINLIDASVPPTMWIGNKGHVAPHYDVHRNLACVMAGKRQFILYPPEQLANLYPGPILDAPGGVPISLVDAWDPDFDKFPRYAEAHAVAQEAVLEPGDAIYIPSLWWHGVASLENVNVLVNYWWDGINASGISPNDSLLHAMLAITGLDDAQRQAWRDYFDYYVFRSGEDPAAHLPSGLKDIVTSLSSEQAKAVREFLAKRLAEDS
ncbi:MAG: cupin-like domain-containing protein [Gammaproteobacteria bacterium]|nr:cupin-like domain-containing protein [Gammaproteobacteria bacterium]